MREAGKGDSRVRQGGGGLEASFPWKGLWGHRGESDGGIGQRLCCVTRGSFSAQPPGKRLPRILMYALRLLDSNVFLPYV